MNPNEAWKSLHDFTAGSGEDHLEDAGREIHVEMVPPRVDNEAEKYCTGIFLKMKEQSGKDPVAKELFTVVLKLTVKYISAVDAHTEFILTKKGQDEKQEREELERISKVRTSAHNVLIDAINIYSRYCYKNKLDKSWRDMLGSEREEITRWAQNVIPLVRYELLTK